MPKYSTGLFNEFVPHLTELTECNALPMDEYKCMTHGLIHQFVITSLFSARYPDPMHQYAIVFLRKTEAAFQEYFYSQSSLSEYVQTQILYNDKPNEQISQYFEILHRFEVLISQIYQAYMVLEKFLLLEKDERFWQRGDGSILEKINTLYNYTKHAEDKIKQKPEVSGYHIWLTNFGVSCEKGSVSYSEIPEALVDLADNAKYYGNPQKVIIEMQTGVYDEDLQKQNDV
jgi:hypothetical protein